MLRSDLARSVERVAAARGIEAAALKAVVEVEAAGQPFAVVNGKNEPLIRYEGHYFDRLVDASRRDEARAAGLSSPSVGGVKNPSGQQERWLLLARASRIDADAALESTSWGLGQVMGAHWQKLGFSSVKEMVATARQDIDGQLELMVRYIEKFGLMASLKRHDWAGFARGYNGSGYKTNSYDTKLAKAYAQYAVAAETQNPASGMLRLGSKGAGVREIQALLIRAGYAVGQDGDFGPATKAAIEQFQTAHGLAVDGVAGPETMRKLKEFQISPDEKPGSLGIANVPEVKSAARNFGPLAFLTAARDQIAEVATYATGINSDLATTIANGLLAASGVIGFGLTAYGLYGWWQSKKTVEQA